MRLCDFVGSCPDNKEILHSNVLVIIDVKNVMFIKDMMARV